MSMLDDMWAAYDEYVDMPYSEMESPFGWPTVFGIGAATHPIDDDHDMIYMFDAGLTRSYWDEQMQCEYAIP